MLKRVPVFSHQKIIASSAQLFREIKMFNHPEQLNALAALTSRKYASLPMKGICTILCNGDAVFSVRLELSF
jgi:hypothetical protein